MWWFLKVLLAIRCSHEKDLDSELFGRRLPSTTYGGGQYSDGTSGRMTREAAINDDRHSPRLPPLVESNERSYKLANQTSPSTLHYSSESETRRRRTCAIHSSSSWVQSLEPCVVCSFSFSRARRSFHCSKNINLSESKSYVISNFVNTDGVLSSLKAHNISTCGYSVHSTTVLCTTSMASWKKATLHSSMP